MGGSGHLGDSRRRWPCEEATRGRSTCAEHGPPVLRVPLQGGLLAAKRRGVYRLKVCARTRREADETPPDPRPAGTRLAVTRKAPKRGQRLAPEARRALLLESAAGMVLEQGYLPLPIQDVAQAAKVSKALVYRYFPEQPDLYNALLEQCMDELCAAGLETCEEPADVAEVYFRYVAGRGPLIHLILRDRFMAGQVSRRAVAVRDRVARRLARVLRGRCGVGLREAVTSVSIGMTMPEECGRLVHQGDLDLERGAQMCRELVLGVVDAASRRATEARR